MNNNNVAVLLPVYNSSRHLERLVRELLKFVDIDQVIAVDDGSQDDSAARCEQLGIELVRFEINQGKGAALLAGMYRAKKLGFEFVITIDSDEQHPPRHIPDFTARQKKEGSGLLMGYRTFRVIYALAADLFKPADQFYSFHHNRQKDQRFAVRLPDVLPGSGTGANLLLKTLSI